MEENGIKIYSGKPKLKDQLVYLDIDGEQYKIHLKVVDYKPVDWIELA
jgi:hypothetical protein